MNYYVLYFIRVDDREFIRVISLAIVIYTLQYALRLIKSKIILKIFIYLFRVSVSLSFFDVHDCKIQDSNYYFIR